MYIYIQTHDDPIHVHNAYVELDVWLLHIILIMQVLFVLAVSPTFSGSLLFNESMHALCFGHIYSLIWRIHVNVSIFQCKTKTPSLIMDMQIQVQKAHATKIKIVSPIALHAGLSFHKLQTQSFFFLQRYKGRVPKWNTWHPIMHLYSLCVYTYIYIYNIYIALFIYVEQAKELEHGYQMYNTQRAHLGTRLRKHYIFNIQFNQYQWMCIYISLMQCIDFSILLQQTWRSMSCTGGARAKERRAWEAQPGGYAWRKRIVTQLADASAAKERYIYIFIYIYICCRRGIWSHFAF